MFYLRFFQLLQSTNNLPSNSKPPQIKMQSTKKAPQRKEDGAAVAGDDGATIAPPAGVNMTQLVRHLYVNDKVQRICSCPVVLFSNSLLCSALSSPVFSIPSFPSTFNTPGANSSFSPPRLFVHPEFFQSPAPNTACNTHTRALRLCFAWLTLSGGGRGRPSGERGQQREQGKK